MSQRKVTLHGARARQTPEDQNEREIRKEIRLVLPQLFGGQHHYFSVYLGELTRPLGESRKIYSSPRPLLDECHTLISASRFEQVRTFRQWLMPIFRKAIDRFIHSGDHMNDSFADLEISQTHSTDFSVLHTYSIIIELLSQTKCYGSILEVPSVTAAVLTSPLIYSYSSTCLC